MGATRVVCLPREGECHGHSIIAFDSEVEILRERNAGFIAAVHGRAFTKKFVIRAIAHKTEMLKFVFNSIKIGVQVVSCGRLRYFVCQQISEVKDYVKRGVVRDQGLLV